MSTVRPYDPEPTYPALGAGVRGGWDALAAELPGGGVLAVDGPQILDWAALVSGLRKAAEQRGIRVRVLDARDHMVEWKEVVRRTAPVEELADDPDFATLPGGTLADLFDDVPLHTGGPDSMARDLMLVYGPGASLAGPDAIWYADLPKRYAESAVAAGRERNVGQRPDDGPPTTRRLFYIDWPLLDRHRDALAETVDLWIDTRDAAFPTSIRGDDLRDSLAALAGGPFRTRPTFNTTSWGGQWAKGTLGFPSEGRNTALGYELIAPESGILLGERGRAAVEVPFQLLVALRPHAVLGEAVHERFGSSFPIRFDYLDTVGGGSLSVHCHPRDDYMRDVFGWPYTQHETYYMMVGGEDAVVYLGLREDVDLAEFERLAHAADDHGLPFDVERFVQTFPAELHRLFLIPAGTPHGSGKGNVVLEVSATPYLYSLRFYDWLRRDGDGAQRPVHVSHAFRNLNRRRSGPAVATDLVQQPQVLSRGDGWEEEVLGSLPEMFFEVRRLRIDAGRAARQDTDGRFHVLNVVEGDGVVLETAEGRHPLAYAETIVVPAAVGPYRVTADDQPARLVKALVR
ncbi:class I mannose-6-phosphate isomerase [Planotetraspora sp. A-T 1434]|uniref:class I mannose-6-phosphate isomerase n=1 Tax=Planotetraspora sp. A-T 1434 TaxID=2979219 RepID=UPI0021BDFB05|nr:class I mannose-6-phosphate isomerase [Planotetraspora sp. A-T 1434]MCT9931290.1 class I mannose-6-phosphate isomerase [Planotetraspora sp. A-T 1434]